MTVWDETWVFQWFTNGRANTLIFFRRTKTATESDIDLCHRVGRGFGVPLGFVSLRIFTLAKAAHEATAEDYQTSVGFFTGVVSKTGVFNPVENVREFVCKIFNHCLLLGLIGLMGQFQHLFQGTVLLQQPVVFRPENRHILCLRCRLVRGQRAVKCPC